jgi:colanic acid/amylovoran biosynthesis glycosyltransferase
MKVGYLVSQYPAASHTFIRREIDSLRQLGVPIETFSVRQPSPQEIVADSDRAAFDSTFYILRAGAAQFVLAHSQSLFTHPIRYLRLLRLALQHRPPGTRGLTWALFYFAEAILLAKELKRRHVQHLHNHFANAGATVGLLASQFLDLPWSLTLHGISETDYPSGLLLAEKVSVAQFVACVSYFGRAQAMRITSPRYWDKFIIVRCALDFQKLPQRVARQIDTSRLRLVCVGRLSPEKGHVGLLTAFARVLARGINAELVLVGSGREKSSIEQKIIELGLEKHVLLTGMLNEDDTLVQIAEADALVMASFMEGLPVVLIEAMALEVPVIAPRVAGIPELVHDEHNGLLFSPSNWDELAERMLQLLSDPALRERLGRAGREHVLASFEISRCVVPLKGRFEERATVFENR